MTLCSHTGISVPECSCRACVQAQIERHQPSLLQANLTGVTDTIEMAAGRRTRIRLATRLRRLRLRRAA
jgi:hypothetical protein